jgi:hypothetical protein
VVFAQALGEYALLSAVASQFDTVRRVVEDWLGRLDATTSLLVGGLVMLWLIVRSFRGRRL